MIVETQLYTFADTDAPFTLESGHVLSPVTLAYETYGTLNPAGDNALLIVHGFTADAHAAGVHADTGKVGWWDDMIGPGKAFDTDRFFVVSSNCIGGCKGSTGPSSVDPATSKPYGSKFPVITIRDMVDAQYRLLVHLGVKSLASVTGASMGGMQALQWLVSYPEFVRTAIPIACAARLSAMSLAMAEVSRAAILSDADWNGGDYYGKSFPAKGLALARMAAHLTYVSAEHLEAEFGRRPIDAYAGTFGVQCELQDEGGRFVGRFDPNSFLCLSAAIENFDLAKSYGSLQAAFAPVKARVLLLSFSTDWLFPTRQLVELHESLASVGVTSQHIDIETPLGHDAFLTDWPKIHAPIVRFLAA
ncbi:MAG TPA: homoserine O-acetyltransferase [Capsulimonadaceae bacterium]|jgi:homoserine O-acetyltransferase